MFVVAGAMAATDLFSTEYVPMLEAVGALKSPVLHSEVAAIGPVSRHSLTHALSLPRSLSALSLVLFGCRTQSKGGTDSTAVLCAALRLCASVSACVWCRRCVCCVHV